MEIQFDYIASRLSNDELMSRIENRQKYLPETTEACIAELQKRGHVFTFEELTVFEQDLKAQRDNVKKSIGSAGFFNSQYKSNLVEDPNAPMLYSRRAVYIFTVLFGALFGSVMLAVNCNRVGNTRGILWVLGFGVAFTALQVIGSDYVNLGSAYYYFCGLLAGICMDFLFWNRLIGNATFYKAKPIWVPLIIGLILLAFVVLSVVLTQNHA